MLHDHLLVVHLPGALTGVLAQLLPFFGGELSCLAHGSGQGLCILRGDEPAAVGRDGGPAAGDVGGDGRLAHGHGFEQGAGHAFAVGGQHEAIALLEVGAHVIGAAKVADMLAFHPAQQLRFGHGGRVGGFQLAQHPAFGLRALLLQQAGGFGKFGHAFVVQQPADEQENGVVVQRARQRPEMVGIQAGARHHACMLLVDNPCFMKELAVVLVVEKSVPHPAQRKAVELLHDVVEGFTVQEGIAQPGHGGHAAAVSPARGDAAVDIGLGGKVEDEVGPLAPVDEPELEQEEQVEQGVLALRGELPQGDVLGVVVFVQVVDILVYGRDDEYAVAGLRKGFQQWLPEVVDVPAAVGHDGYSTGHLS